MRHKILYLIGFLAVASLAMSGCLGAGMAVRGAAIRGAVGGAAVRGAAGGMAVRGAAGGMAVRGAGAAAARSAAGASAARIGAGRVLAIGAAAGVGAAAGAGMSTAVRGATTTLVRARQGSSYETTQVFTRGELRGTVRINKGEAVIYDKWGSPIARAVLRGSRIDLIADDGGVIGSAYIRSGGRVDYFFGSEMVGYDLIKNNTVYHFGKFGEYIGQTTLSEPVRDSFTAAVLAAAGLWGMGILDNNEEQQRCGCRELVKRAQIRLVEEGFDSGPIDGILGRLTLAAVREYQVYYGLPATGQLDNTTLQSLGIDQDY